MKRRWLKASGILWLIFVTPVLGLLPLLLLTEIISPYGDAGRYAVALLRDVNRVVLSDPAPESSHVGFYDLASASVWVVITSVVFIVAALSVYYLWRLYARRAA
jgi:hypothetical protein